MAGANVGGDLEYVETEQLGLVGVSAERQLRLLPSPWPADNLPPVTASLLSLAPNRGLLAAAGPDTLVVGTTQSVRETLMNGQPDDDFNKVSKYQPAASIPIPRVSHVAFSADESCLIIAAEQGGGLAIYETTSITNGSKESQLQIGTNNVSIRHLIPNPARASWELVAIVLSEGQLLLADLKQQNLSQGSKGNAVFAEKVYCAGWSRLGKQLVVGRADGTAQQIDLSGNVKAEIPAPPQLSQSMPCTSIFWLDTFVFITVHGPVAEPTDGGMAEPPVWHLVSRDKASGACDFRPIQDPVPPGFDARLPPNHFMQRIRDWKPHLEDCLILACSGATDIGFITKADAPLQQAHPRVSETLSPHYTSTAVPDHRRGQLPTSIISSDDGMAGNDTFPIGFCLDASVTEPAAKPFLHTTEPSEKPLPAILALNQEGVVQGWYVVYSDSARQALPFPGSVAAGLGEQGTFGQNVGKAATSNTQSQSVPQGAFGASPAPNNQPAFAQGGTTTHVSAAPSPAFGGASLLGQKGSIWGGTASGMGSTKPVFGQSGGGSTFGSASTINASQPSTQPFGSASGGSASVFGGGMSSGGGFASLGAKSAVSGGGLFGPSAQSQQASISQTGNTGSIFAGAKGPNSEILGAGPSKPGGGLFGSRDNNAVATPSPFGSLGGNNSQSTGFSFGGLKTNDTTQKPAPSSFGAPKQETSFASTATLGSTSGGSTLGSSWGKPSVPSREETMSDDDDGTATETPAASGTQKEASPFTGPGSGFNFSGLKMASTFKGDGTAKNDLPKPTDGGESAFKNMFGSSLDITTEKKAAELEIKKEPGMEEENLKDIPESAASAQNESVAKKDELSVRAEAAPLPPMWAPGETEKAFTDDAPLPPDPTIAKPKRDDSGPLAGSPPVDLGKETFPPSGKSPKAEEKESAGPLESEDGWSDEQEEREGSEEETGEDEDDVSDEDEGSDEAVESEDELSKEHTVEDQLGLDSFMSRVTPASPKIDAPTRKEQQRTPESERKDKEPLSQSYTPAGMPPGMPHPPTAAQFPAFQPPARESPRSPSPTRREVRNATSPSRLTQQPPKAALVHADPKGRQETSLRPQPPKQTTVPPAQAFPQISGGSVTYGNRSQQGMRQTSGLSQVTYVTQPEPQPEPDMDDPAHAYNTDRMKERPEKTLTVPNFIAHADHVGDDTKEGVFGSMEKVLRDINSMVDIIGLNAHYLAGFVDAHEELSHQNGDRPKDDLDDPDKWCLEEVADLEVAQRFINKALEDGRLENVREKLRVLQHDETEAARLKRKAQDLRKQIRMHTDPQKNAQQYLAPLPPETQIQQAELRESIRRVQTLLAKVEDAMSLLRADLASVPSHSTGKSSTADNAPTVEAVENTIRKMTTMIERKSGDIDVLEAQVRRLPSSVLSSLNSLNLKSEYEDDLVSALENSRFARTTKDGSPFATPPPRSRARMAARGESLGTSGMFESSKYQTPPSVSFRASRRDFNGGNFSAGNPLAMSTLSVNSTSSARKKMNDVTTEEVIAHHLKSSRRGKILGALKSNVERENERDPRARVVNAK